MRGIPTTPYVRVSRAARRDARIILYDVYYRKAFVLEPTRCTETHVRRRWWKSWLLKRSRFRLCLFNKSNNRLRIICFQQRISWITIDSRSAEWHECAREFSPSNESYKVQSRGTTRKPPPQTPAVIPPPRPIYDDAPFCSPLSRGLPVYHIKRVKRHCRGGGRGGRYSRVSDGEGKQYANAHPKRCAVRYI